MYFNETPGSTARTIDHECVLVAQYKYCTKIVHDLPTILHSYVDEEVARKKLLYIVPLGRSIPEDQKLLPSDFQKLTSVKRVSDEIVYFAGKIVKVLSKICKDEFSVLEQRLENKMSAEKKNTTAVPAGESRSTRTATINTSSQSEVVTNSRVPQSTNNSRTLLSTLNVSQPNNSLMRVQKADVTVGGFTGRANGKGSADAEKQTSLNTDEVIVDLLVTGHGADGGTGAGMRTQRDIERAATSDMAHLNTFECSKT
jgi:hypothetical protein